jgi:hypothetical protein
VFSHAVLLPLPLLLLLQVAAGETDTSKLGDTSTLADPAVVDALIASRAKHAK